MHGNRSIYHDGWMASAFHGRVPWSVGLPGAATPFEDDVWELYNLEEDFSQANDLAASNPKKLKQMQKLFDKEARRIGILPLRNALDILGQGLPSLTGDRTEFTYYAGAVGIPEAGAPPMLNRSWSLRAEIDASGDAATQGVIATIGGHSAGWSLYLDADSKPVFEYRTFEVGRVRLAGKQPVNGKQTLQVDFDYNGGGYARGGSFSLKVDGSEVASGSIVATPPAFFSIDETFDVGVDTGSAAGRYPTDAPLSYPYTGGEIERVTIQLR